MSQKSEIKTLHSLNQQWGAAATRLDLEAVVALFARDAALLWPDQKLVRGTAGIRKAWRQTMKDYPGLKLVFTPERIDLSASGDLALDCGKVEFTAGLGKERASHIGKYLVAWRKVDGAWKVAYDSWSMNAAS